VRVNPRPPIQTNSALRLHDAPTQEGNGHKSELAPAGGGPLPLLIDLPTLCFLLCRSKASIFRDLAAGRLPRPHKLGSSLRWNREEVVGWVRAGMPSLKEWEASKAAQKRAKR